MQDRVEAYVAKWHMIEQGDKIVVGVSGGADSVCLLFVLLKLREKLPFEIYVVHVHHGLRGTRADADEAYVAKLCREYALPYRCYHRDVGAVARDRKQSEEEAGREIRREVFADALKTFGATKIALAHHKNDNVETFLLNLSRGSGLRGLGGIRPVAGWTIRPLLCLERGEIETYLKERGIDYCTDETNKEDKYTRNRIRNHVVPYLESEINGAAVAHISDAIEQLQAVEQYFAGQIDFYFQTCVKQEGNGYSLEEESYLGLPEVMKPLLMKKLLSHVARREKDITATHIHSLQELFERQVGRKIDLPYRVVAKRVYRGIHFSIRQETGDSEFREALPIRFTEHRDVSYETAMGTVSCRLQNRDALENEDEKRYTKRFDYGIITSELCIRTRRAGDYITLHPDGGTQKLKSYFINEKIPEEERDRILLIADGSHILWIVGYRTNPVYRVREESKQILEIQVDKGERYNGRDN